MATRPGRGKTKNPFILNGLAVFDVTLDCAPANNRLKRRKVRTIEPGRIRVLHRNLLSTSDQRSFSCAKTADDSRRENVLPPCGLAACGNWESDERDIRDKI